MEAGCGHSRGCWNRQVPGVAAGPIPRRCSIGTVARCGGVTLGRAAYFVVLVYADGRARRSAILWGSGVAHSARCARARPGEQHPSGHQRIGQPLSPASGGGRPRTACPPRGSAARHGSDATRQSPRMTTARAVCHAAWPGPAGCHVTWHWRARPSCRATTTDAGVAAPRACDANPPGHAVSCGRDGDAVRVRVLMPGTTATWAIWPRRSSRALRAAEDRHGPPTRQPLRNVPGQPRPADAPADWRLFVMAHDRPRRSCHGSVMWGSVRLA
jgi:hypothetical protein